jgi:cell division protein FtsQ
VREQAISHKVGNRSGMGKYRASAGANQRPTRRESESEGLVERLRAIVGYLPVVFKVVLAIVMGILVFAGYRAAASASFFQVRNIEVQGTSRVAADEVRAIVRKDVEKTGVWRADLKGLNAHLEKLTWIRSAVVSRVLPDGIRVRITERTPRAVVRTASGRFRWVDDDAVLLGEMQPTDQMPPFFLRGLNEEDPDGARDENKERVSKFLELQKAWDEAGLSERVSELNLMDVRDVRAQLAGENSHIEVRLGSQDQAKRLKDALDVLDGQRQAGRGATISYIDLSQGKRAIVGLASGAHRSDDATTNNAAPATAADNSAANDVASLTPNEKQTTDNNKNLEPRARKDDNKAKPKDKPTDKSKKTDRARR